MASLSTLPAADCRIISRVGTWDVSLPNPDEWILDRLKAIGDVPLGPYFLVLDYDSGGLHLMHGVSFQRQIIKGANMEHLGTAYIGDQAYYDWVHKGL